MPSKIPTNKKSKKLPPKKKITPLVPKEFVTAPFFAAVRQSEPRQLSIGDYLWTIGVDHPTERRPSPALDIRHGRACFTLLSFMERYSNTRDIKFSMYEFCRRYARQQGGRYNRDLLGLLFDLQETWVSRAWTKGDVDHEEKFTIIGEIKVHHKVIKRADAKEALTNQTELSLDRVSLSPEFFELLAHWENLTRIRLDVLTSIRSPKAQAIYAYIPSRASYHSKSNPFSITTTRILEQISATIPSAKSKRHQIFTQNKNSVLSQLDGVETMDGILKVSIEETVDGSDYKLNFWKEENPEMNRPDAAQKSKSLEAWLRSGRSEAEYRSKASKARPLDFYQIDNLEKACVTLEGNQPFFELMLALLGPSKFDQIVSDTKSDVLEGRSPNNPTGRTIYQMIAALRAG